MKFCALQCTSLQKSAHVSSSRVRTSKGSGAYESAAFKLPSDSRSTFWTQNTGGRTSWLFMSQLILSSQMKGFPICFFFGPKI